MGLEAAEGGARLDVKDLDEAGEVRGGEEAGVGAEGGACDDVGEGGDGGGGGERQGAEESEGGGVCGGKKVKGCRRERGGRNKDEIENLLGLEGGPVLGFRGLLRGFGFRFKSQFYQTLII